MPLGSTYSMETKSKLATHLNMSTPESILMAKLTSPLDSLGVPTLKSYIKCGHLLGTSDHKLRERELLQIIPREWASFHVVPTKTTTTKVELMCTMTK